MLRVRVVRGLWLMLLLVVGCVPVAPVPWGTVEPPEVRAILPSARVVGEGGVSVVHGAHLQPVYNASTDEEIPVQIFLDGVELTVLELDGSGTQVTVEVPGSLSVGSHALRVRTAAGEDVLDDAYRVTP